MPRPKKTPEGAKTKAERVPIAQLNVVTAYAKTFKSGKTGWFGKVIDPLTGDQYQIVGAVKIES